jgi:hypothetical protein
VVGIDGVDFPALGRYEKDYATYITEIAPTDDGYDFTGLTQMIGWRGGLQHAPRLAAAAF